MRGYRLHMLRLWWVVVLSGCSLYFSSGDDDDDAMPPSPDAYGDPTVVARPCIRAVAVGELLLGGTDNVFLTYVCDVDGAGAIIEYFNWTNGQLTPAGPARGDVQEPFERALIVDSDGRLPIDVLTINKFSPGGWVFLGNGGWRYESARPFSDATAANLDGVAPYELVFAGDNAIRMQLGMFAQNETELVTGKPFVSVAVAQLGTTAARRDLFYVAGTPTGPTELGIALQTSAQPLTYQMTTLVTEPNGPRLPLVVADVDGDAIGDVIGATSHVFVRSSKTGTLLYLEETASALAAGDTDGDGIAEPVFITGDRTAVRRVRVADERAAARRRWRCHRDRQTERRRVRRHPADP